MPDVEHAATIASVTPAPAAAPATVPAATPAVAPGLLGPPRKVLAVYPQTKEISPLGLRFEDNLEIGAMSPNAICGQPQLEVGMKLVSVNAKSTAGLQKLQAIELIKQVDRTRQKLALVFVAGTTAPQTAENVASSLNISPPLRPPSSSSSSSSSSSDSDSDSDPTDQALAEPASPTKPPPRSAKLQQSVRSQHGNSTTESSAAAQSESDDEDQKAKVALQVAMHEQKRQDRIQRQEEAAARAADKELHRQVEEDARRLRADRSRAARRASAKKEQAQAVAAQKKAEAEAIAAKEEKLVNAEAERQARIKRNREARETAVKTRVPADQTMKATVSGAKATESEVAVAATPPAPKTTSNKFKVVEKRDCCRLSIIIHSDTSHALSITKLTTSNNQHELLQMVRWFVLLMTQKVPKKA